MRLKSLLAKVYQPAFASKAYLFLWIFLVLWSYLKGYAKGCQGWGKYFWLVDYSHGFIKRGFVGTLIRGLGLTLDHVSWFTLEAVVAGLHSLFALLTIALLVNIQREFFIKPRRFIYQPNLLLLSSGWLIFACTQFWPTLGYNSGYLDIYLLFAYSSCFYLFAKQRYLAAAMIGSLMILVHEGFFFLWISLLAAFVMVLFLRTQQINRSVILLGSLPLLTLALTLLLHNQAAAVAEVNSIPDTVIDPTMKEALIQAQFGQTLQSSLFHMANLWRNYAMQAIAAFGYYTWPSFLIVGVTPLILDKANIRARTIAAILITSFLPLLILVVAWDLSRFLVWTNLSTILSLTYFTTAELDREIPGETQ